MKKVSNMDAALTYFLKYNAGNVSFVSLLDDDFSDEEGLYYVRKEYDFPKIAKVFEDKRNDMEGSGLDAIKKEERMKGVHAWEERLKVRRNEFLSSEVDYEQGMKLLREHYNQNVDKLNEYGLDIKKKEVEF